MKLKAATGGPCLVRRDFPAVFPFSHRARVAPRRERPEMRIGKLPVVLPPGDCRQGGPEGDDGDQNQAYGIANHWVKPAG